MILEASCISVGQKTVENADATHTQSFDRIGVATTPALGIFVFSARATRPSRFARLFTHSLGHPVLVRSRRSFRTTQGGVPSEYPPAEGCLRSKSLERCSAIISGAKNHVECTCEEPRPGRANRRFGKSRPVFEGSGNIWLFQVFSGDSGHQAFGRHTKTHRVAESLCD